MISIGIDTGGTYTDAVAIDRETGKIIAKGKSPTTKENLAIGIENALNCIPDELLQVAGEVTLSTTLATNACVENKGGRAKLAIVGIDNEVFYRLGSAREFGLNNDTVMCFDAQSSFDGRVVDEPNWDELFEQNAQWFSDAEALSVAAVFSMNNGGIVEKNAKKRFEDRFSVPVVAACELANEINVFQRGATAILNARLIPVINEFTKAVEDTFEKKGIDARSYVIRSDGSLMSHAVSKKRPVDTILSGPAASVLGGHKLAGSTNSLIIDMGGTTTDISIVKDGAPKMCTDGVHIGGWNTQIKGVFVDTFALGGDSVVRMVDGKLALSNRRALPLCFAASRWPQIKDELRALNTSRLKIFREFHEFLYLVKEPQDISKCSEPERNLIEALRNGPRMIEFMTREEDGVDKYHLQSEQLETDGIIMRCGFTPTDVMHIRGDYSMFDKEASELGAGFFVKWVDGFHGKTIYDFAETIHDMVCKKLYVNIVRILLQDKFASGFENGADQQIQAIISETWDKKDKDGLLKLDFSTPAALVGIGAPIHVFLPKVAEALGTEYIIPEHAEVANAVGAVSADITATVRAEIHPIYEGGGIVGYSVHSPSGMQGMVQFEDAKREALKAAEADAIIEARSRGALGELIVESSIESTTMTSGEGARVSFGYFALATATDRLKD